MCGRSEVVTDAPGSGDPPGRQPKGLATEAIPPPVIDRT
jgi:hypothetical protein